MKLFRKKMDAIKRVSVVNYKTVFTLKGLLLNVAVRK